jgi:hypothetical protein
VVHHDRAEADDVVATIVRTNTELRENREFGQKPIEPDIIVSGDFDFCQLHSGSVKQWDHAGKRFVEVASPAKHLKRKIIKGDSGDGVPNMLSADDCLVTGKRQKPVYEVKLEAWLDMDPKDFAQDETELRNYYRNKTMVDLSCIPEEVKIEILDKYVSAEKVGYSRSAITEYFIASRLRNLMADVQYF